MNFKIDCFNFVMLYGLNKLVDVDIKKNDFSFENKTIKGTVDILGKYLKEDDQNVYEFCDNVPYTIVFRDEILDVNCLKVEDFTYDIISDGLDCKFTIEVEYNLVNDVSDKITEEYNEKLEDLLETRIEDVSENILPFKDVFSENKTRYKYIYYRSDTELEKISKEEQVSLNTLFNNSQDLGDYKRIILKE